MKARVLIISSFFALSLSLAALAAPLDWLSLGSLSQLLPLTQVSPPGVPLDSASATWKGNLVEVKLKPDWPSRSGKLKWKVTLRNLAGDLKVSADGIAQPGAEILANLELPAPLDSEDAAMNYVLSWKFEHWTAVSSGSRSLYHLKRRPVLSARIPEHLFANQESRLSFVLSDALTAEPYRNSPVELVLKQSQGDPLKLSARTDDSGLAGFTLPPMGVGRVSLKASAELDVVATARADLEVVRENRIHLSTDKPIYQPGQEVHIRTLILRKPDLKPAQAQETLLEILDPKGNKVHKELLKTNDFGVTSTIFRIGGLVNLGPYKLVLTVGATTAEKTITVDRYVLPKFKVDLTLQPEALLPGEVVEGTLNTAYFFGKPVAGGEVKVVFYDYQATWVEDKVITGTTNDEGIFHFSHGLPARLIGQPLDNGKASVLMKLTVRDTGGQVVQVERRLLVSQSPVDIRLVPESGAVVPGVKNRFFLVASDSSGSPLAGELSAKFSSPCGDHRINMGLGTSWFTVLEHEACNKTGEVQAEVSIKTEKFGPRQASFSFPIAAQGSSVLLHTSSAMLRTGDPLEFEILSAGAIGPAYLEVVRDGQTLLTATVPMSRGKGTYSLVPDQGMTGTLAVSAYVLGLGSDFVRDTRVVFVDQPNALNLDISLDKQTYLPGQSAQVKLAVTSPEGTPVPSLLGIQVVDQAVFALSEAKPGLLKLFFKLEEELMKPTYQVGQGLGQTLGQLLTSGERFAGRDAQVVLAAQGDMNLSGTRISSWLDERGKLRARLDNFQAIARAGIVEKVLQKDSRCDSFVDSFSPLSRKRLQKPRRDPWGNRYKLKLESTVARFTSAGPDRIPDSWDDLAFELYPMDICPIPRSLVMYDQAPGDGFGPGFMFEGAALGGGGMNVETATLVKSRDMRDEITVTEESRSTSKKSGSGPRVREWFPETLFVNNALLTDDQGNAVVTIPLADSITSWRLSALASDAQGSIGGRDTDIRVFQDFFIDVDFPVYLTRNDRIEFPVVVYNYLKTKQKVTIKLENAPWFSLEGKPESELMLEPGEVRAISFPVKILEVGWHSLTVSGAGQGGFADAVKRTVQVRPDGREVPETHSGSFPQEGGTAKVDLRFPPNTIPGSRSGQIRILPGLSSHVVDGMDALLKLPGGCFEQTSSSAWPNVLALRYLRETGQGTPEIEMKAMQYINSGYQRILTFECPSGGFNWWQGDQTGNLILSAFGIMMLTDTGRVHDAVDRNVIDRAFRFLAKNQEQDGSWQQETHLHAGNENLGVGQLRTTCYIAWAMAEGGYRDSSEARAAINFIKPRLEAEKDLYTLGICVNALAGFGDDGPEVNRAVDQIMARSIRKDDHLYWNAESMTLVQSGGTAAQVEVTSLMALALIATKRNLKDVAPIVSWLTTTKDPNGTWGYNTQATVLALKTFMAAARTQTVATDAVVKVRVNGKEVASKSFDDFNRDVVWQVDLRDEELGAGAELSLEAKGQGNLSWQAVTTHFLPAEKAQKAAGPLAVEVEYDRKKIKVNDMVVVKVKVTRNDDQSRGPLLLTLGLPPGFDLVTDDLDRLKLGRKIRNWEMGGRQLILYLDEIPPDSDVYLDYRLKARFPVSASTGESELRYYYQSQIRTTSEAVKMEAE